MMRRWFIVNITRLKIAAGLIFLQSGLFPPAQAQVTSYNFRHLTNTEGLSDGFVRAIVQDKYGFIWIGTSYGLNRFDGINIKSFFSNHGDRGSLISSYITSLYCDTKRNLWIG